MIARRIENGIDRMVDILMCCAIVLFTILGTTLIVLDVHYSNNSDSGEVHTEVQYEVHFEPGSVNWRPEVSFQLTELGDELMIRAIEGPVDIGINVGDLGGFVEPVDLDTRISWAAQGNLQTPVRLDDLVFGQTYCVVNGAVDYQQEFVYWGMSTYVSKFSTVIYTDGRSGFAGDYGLESYPSGRWNDVNRTFEGACR